MGYGTLRDLRVIFRSAVIEVLPGGDVIAWEESLSRNETWSEE
jgi:hypothetical protein